MATSSTRSVFVFFAAILFGSLPFYVLNYFNVALPFNLPLSATMIIMPILVAAILIYRSGGYAAVRAWLLTVGDITRIKNLTWLLVTIGFFPVVSLVAYVIALLTGHASSGVIPSPLAMVLTIVVFVIGAIFEELGWTAFATAPLQKRYGIFTAGLIIGVVWALWHVIPFLQIGRAPTWVALHSLTIIANRIIMGYLFTKTNRTTSPALFYHAAINYMPEFFPGTYASYHPGVTAAVLWAIIGIALIKQHTSNKTCPRTIGG